MRFSEEPSAQRGHQELRELKLDIARIKTIARERELASRLLP